MVIVNSRIIKRRSSISKFMFTVTDSHSQSPVVIDKSSMFLHITFGHLNLIQLISVRISSFQSLHLLFLYTLISYSISVSFCILGCLFYIAIRSCIYRSISHQNNTLTINNHHQHVPFQLLCRQQCVVRGAKKA